MRTVLLVEDDVTIRELLIEFFEDTDFKLEAVANGADALTLLKSDLKPRFILLDSQMPFLSGAEFMEEFRKHSSHAEIPVYLFSAGNVEAEAKELGCAGFLKKPFNLPALIALLEKYK